MPDQSPDGSHKHPASFSDFIGSVWFKAAFFLLLAAVAFIAYWPTLHDALFCDDYYNMGLDKVPLLSDPSASTTNTLSSFQWVTTAFYPFFFRPAVLTVWLVLSKIFGTNPWPYHMLSILLHAGNAWLIFWLLRKLKTSITAAILPAALFLLTPIAPEAVAWSSGYYDLFALFFLLLGLGSYATFLQRGKSRYYVLSLVAITVAFFSKETALIAIAALPVMDLLLAGVLRSSESGNMPSPENRKSALRRAAVRTAPLGAVFMVYMILRYAFLGRIYESNYFSAWTNRMGPLISFRTFLAPFSNSYFGTGIITGIFFYSGIMSITALILVKRNWIRTTLLKKRLWLFFLIMFIFSLIPVYASLRNGISNNMINSRYLYMGTAFGFSLIAISLFEFARNARFWAIAGSLALVLLLPLYAWGLETNNRDWESRSSVDSEILSQMQTLLPEPPDKAKIYLLEEDGKQQYALYWCSPLLQPAVRLDYQRYDIQVFQGTVDSFSPGLPETDDGYLFLFSGRTGRLILEHGPLS